MSETVPPPRMRMSKEERERQIVREATLFFADVGIYVDTTALSRRLNVTQPLLYKYFPTKEALIQRVFREVFVTTWNPRWEDMLTDPAVSLADRLVAFHQDFARVHLVRERVRLNLFFALAGWDMSEYFTLMRERVYFPIAYALRRLTGEPGLMDLPLRDLEFELAKNVVEKIQYYGMRKFVFGTPMAEDINAVIEMCVCDLLEGAPAAIVRFKDVGKILDVGQTPYQQWIRSMAGHTRGGRSK